MRNLFLFCSKCCVSCIVVDMQEAIVTLGLLTEGRAEFLKRHMVKSDKAICCSASTSRVEGVGSRGVENSFRWGVEGVDILGYCCHHSERETCFFGVFQAEILENL